jgi:CHASE2 domain-containing sensor protein
MEGEFPCASWLPIICQNLAEVPPSWNDLFAPEIVVSESLPRRRRFRRRGLQKVLIASVMVTCLVMGMRYFGLLQSLELHAFNKMMQLRPAEAEDSRILVVKVTEEDIKYLKGQHPLHDDTMLQLLKKLEEYQPRVIGLNIYRDRPEGKGRADLVQYLQQKSDRIIPLCTNSYQGDPAVLPPPGIDKKRLGFSDVFHDPDQVIRRQVLVINPLKDRPALKTPPSPCPALYALSFQLAFRYLDAKNIKLKFTPKKQLQLGSVIFQPLEPHTGFYQNVDMGGYQVMINYQASFNKDSRYEVTLQEILENQLDADFVKGKIMIIGMKDHTVSKSFKTPYSPPINALTLHAQMVSHILSAVEDQRPLLWFLPLWNDAILVLACCLLGGMIVTWRLQILHQGLAVVFLVIIIAGASFSFILVNGLLLPLVPSIIGLLTTSSYLAYKK